MSIVLNLSCGVPYALLFLSYCSFSRLFSFLIADHPVRQRSDLCYIHLSPTLSFTMILLAPTLSFSLQPPASVSIFLLTLFLLMHSRSSPSSPRSLHRTSPMSRGSLTRPYRLRRCVLREQSRYRICSDRYQENARR